MGTPRFFAVRTEKKSTPYGVDFFCKYCLLGNDSLNGAVAGAGAAIHAGISVDLVLSIALGDSLDGAVVSAGTAANASVSDLVSHEYVLLFI